MIYVIESTWYNKETKELTDLVKIGYTDDNNIKRRVDQYKLHNPECRVLYTIDNGTLQDETNLHLYFSQFKYDRYGNEWFYYNDEIIEFFDNHKTVESLSGLVVKLKGQFKIPPSYYVLIKRLVNRWFCIDQKHTETLDLKEVIGYLHDNFRIYSTKELIYEHLKTTYKVTKKVITEIDKFLTDKLDNSDVAKDFLAKFCSLSNFKEKMKLVCECGLGEEDLYNVLDQIPIVFKNYYLTLGPNRCKALSYNVTDISRAYSDTFFDKNALKQEIYGIFIVGEKYAMSTIKSTLGNLYKRLGYNKSPMATDLSEYFELRQDLLTLEDKRRVNAFKLLDRK